MESGKAVNRQRKRRLEVHICQRRTHPMYWSGTMYWSGRHVSDVGFVQQQDAQVETIRRADLASFLRVPRHCSDSARVHVTRAGTG